MATARRWPWQSRRMPGEMRCWGSCPSRQWGDMALRRMGMLSGRVSSCNPPLACRENTVNPWSGSGMQDVGPG